MNGYLKLVGLLAVAGFVSPAHAGVRETAFSSSADRSRVQTATFAGVTYRIGFNRNRGEPRHRASLVMGGMTHSAESPERRIGRGIELTVGKSGRAALHVGGANLGELKRTGSLSSGATIALVAVGAVLVGGAIYVAGQLEEARNSD